MKKIKDFIKKAAPVYHPAFVGFFRPGEADPMAEINSDPRVPAAPDVPVPDVPVPDVTAPIAGNEDEYKPFFVGFMNRGKKKSPPKT